MHLEPTKNICEALLLEGFCIVGDAQGRNALMGGEGGKRALEFEFLDDGVGLFPAFFQCFLFLADKAVVGERADDGIHFFD